MISAMAWERACADITKSSMAAGTTAMPFAKGQAWQIDAVVDAVAQEQVAQAQLRKSPSTW